MGVLSKVMVDISEKLEILGGRFHAGCGPDCHGHQQALLCLEVKMYGY